jgi:hypothetical protein
MNTKIYPSESRISYGGHVFNGLEQNEQTLYLLPTKFISFGEAVLEEKICSDIDQLPVAAMFVNGSKLNEQWL